MQKLSFIVGSRFYTLLMLGLSLSYWTLSLQAAETNYTRTEAQYVLPTIELTRLDGVKVKLPEELEDGRAVILNFIFTSCAAICPMMSHTMSSLQKKFGSDLAKVHMVSVSIDPEYDNSVRLQEYATKFKAEPQWQFYTGSVENITVLQKEMDAYRGDKMNHSSTVYLRKAAGQPWVRLEGFLSADTIYQVFQGL